MLDRHVFAGFRLATLSACLRCRTLIGAYLLFAALCGLIALCCTVRTGTTTAMQQLQRLLKMLGDNMFAVQAGSGWIPYEKKSRVGSPRRFREIDSEFLRTCSMSHCQPVNKYGTVCVRFFFAPDIWSFILFWIFKNEDTPNSRLRKKTSLSGRQGLKEYICKISGSTLFGLLSGEHVKFA